MHQRDQDSERGDPGEERLGPVQRIQHPDELGVFLHRRVLLTGNTVIRIGLLDELAQDAFGVPVDRRDGAAVGLDLDLQCLTEVATMDLARRIDQPIGELDEFFGTVFQ